MRGQFSLRFFTIRLFNRYLKIFKIDFPRGYQPLRERISFGTDRLILIMTGS